MTDLSLQRPILVAAEASLDPMPERYLAAAGLTAVLRVYDVSSTEALFAQHAPCLTILSTTLPGGDPFALCQRLAAQGDHAGVLMILHRDAVMVPPAFDAGAVDVIAVEMLSAVGHRARRLIESYLAQRAEQRQRIYAEALGRAAALLTSTLNVNEVLDRILVLVNEVVPSDAANVMLIEDDTARIVRWRGYRPYAADPEMAALRFPIATTSNLDRMIKRNRVEIIPDVSTFEGWVRVPATNWVASHMAAPIRVSGEQVGFLNLDSHLPAAFRAEDGSRLQAFADQAGIALINARHYALERAQADSLRRQVKAQRDTLDMERTQTRTILDSVADGVVYSSLEGRVQVMRYANRAMQALTGYTSQEWIDQWWRAFQPPQQSDETYTRVMDTFIDEILANGIWYGEYQVMRKDGSHFDASESSSLVRAADGAPLGIVSIIRDISAQKALEDQKRRFVGVASHELRSPLSSLNARLHTLRRSPDQLPILLPKLEGTVEQMQRLLDDLISLSSFESGALQLRLQTVRVQDLIREGIEQHAPQAERRRLTITAEFPDALNDEGVPEAFDVRADPDRLMQALSNLISNAIHYTPEGGRVTLRARLDDSGVWIEVEDTGIGIPGDELTKLFQPFYRGSGAQRMARGSGLGLSITREIIDRHGGGMDVQSETGRGSTFRFWLPHSP